MIEHAAPSSASHRSTSRSFASWGSTPRRSSMIRSSPSGAGSATARTARWTPARRRAPVRWHIKRYAPARWHGRRPARGPGTPALIQAQVPTADLVGWGMFPSGRSFVIFADLSGYVPADKLIESGMPFDRLLIPTPTGRQASPRRAAPSGPVSVSLSGETG